MNSRLAALDALDGFGVWASLPVGSWPGSSIEKACRAAEGFDLVGLPELPAREGAETLLGQLSAPSELPCAWAAWLDALEARGAVLAKVQVCGPLTARAFARRGHFAGGEQAAAEACERRALALCAQLQGRGLLPVIFLDEPGAAAAAADGDRPEALEGCLQRLAGAGAAVGVHCCASPPSWLWGCGADLLSFDVAAVDPAGARDAVAQMRARGTRPVLGAVDTSGSGADPVALSAFLAELDVAEAWLSPACGFGALTWPQAKAACAQLVALQLRLRKSSLRSPRPLR